MKHLPNLFTLIELTRNMPQTGYVLAGINKNELSNLAEHQYLVTFISWQLAKTINRKGGNLNIQRTMEYALVHDISELFGGDINFHYRRSNPEAFTLAKEFENKNAEYLAPFFERDKDTYLALFKEFENSETDEAIVSKIADLLECIHYKAQLNKLDKQDLELTTQKLLDLAEKCNNLQNSFVLKNIIENWSKEFNTKTASEIINKTTTNDTSSRSQSNSQEPRGQVLTPETQP